MDIVILCQVVVVYILKLGSIGRNKEFGLVVEHELQNVVLEAEDHGVVGVRCSLDVLELALLLPIDERQFALRLLLDQTFFKVYEQKSLLPHYFRVVLDLD